MAGEAGEQAQEEVGEAYGAFCWAPAGSQRGGCQGPPVPLEAEASAEGTACGEGN